LLFHDSIVPPLRRQKEVIFLERELAVSKSMSILDLACGHGRHTNLLAQKVRQVVAVDRSEQFLQIAQAEASQLGVRNVAYRNLDIRQIEFTEEFDGVILANTVFGLFSDSDNENLLNRIARSLKVGGRLCLDVINRDTILAGFNSHSVTELEGDYLIERLTFDPQSGRMLNDRVYLRDGQSVSAPFSLRLYNYTEMHSLFHDARLRIIAARDDWGGGDFHASQSGLC
jgi:ubiquinone/menaquinone biosynthesis C-methylase UbiE